MASTDTRQYPSTESSASGGKDQSSQRFPAGWLWIPVWLAALLTGAHFLRQNQLPLVALSLGAPLLAVSRRRWAAGVLQLLLLAAAGVWLRTLVVMVNIRRTGGLPWGRLALIVGGVAVFVALTALVFELPVVRRRFTAAVESSGSAIGTFVLTVGLLAVVQLVVHPPMLLAERFLAGAGWVEIVLLGVYAAWVNERMLQSEHSSRWRRRIWTLFSLVFFGQLLAGLAGSDQFLMTGRLHLPVPALIIAGPIFRGGGLFMVILFAVTVLLTGPAWCSHLCYVGAWDHFAAGHRSRPGELPTWRRGLRLAVLVLVILVALGLRLAGAPSGLALALAVGFGVVSVGLMVTWSRRTGVMSHCVAWCPMGLLATWWGRLNPFRLRIGSACDRCGCCSMACRYDALGPENLRRGQPGGSCTLCGDCLARCRKGALTVYFPGLDPVASRKLFLVMIVALHAVFLGVARI